MLETPLGERSERASEASEASRAIRMDSVSCRVKAVQKMPSGFVKVVKKSYSTRVCTADAFSLAGSCSREVSLATRFPFLC